MTRHVHARSDEMHTFAAQPHAMGGEGRKSVGVDDSMERQVRLVAVP